MKNLSVKKLALAGMLCALAVVGSVFSFPIFGSKCAPVQHMVNILCAVLLGPYWGLGVAFVASLLRNLLGLGSLMAFPGSMFGALLCGVVYHKTQKLLPTLVGEVFGTSILGGLCAYPVAILLMGKSAGDIAFYAYIVPFLVSTAGGAAALRRSALDADQPELRRPVWKLRLESGWTECGKPPLSSTASRTSSRPTTVPTSCWRQGPRPSWRMPRRRSGRSRP